jgi:hypothetical protein
MNLFSYNENRDAYATIRGFVYQVDITIDKWLDLSDNGQLYLECGEDIDEVKGDIRLLGQVKHNDKNTFTINTESFVETLSNFRKHRMDNPTLKLQLQYITNAHIRCEKTALFDDGKSKTRTKALDVWVEIGKTTILTPVLQEKIEIIRKQILKTVTNLCSKVVPDSPDRSRQKDDSDKKNYQAFKEFLEKVGSDDWFAFIQAVTLDCGKTPADGYSKALQDKIQQKYPKVHAENFYEQLFTFVFKKLTNKESKMLDCQQLADRLQRHQENRFDDGFKSLLYHTKLIINELSDLTSKADAIKKDTTKTKKGVKKLLKKEVISLKQALVALNTDYNSIRKQRRTFAQLPNSHLMRQEVDRVIDLLQGKVAPNELLVPVVIAGAAGMGKSVITTDLLDKLSQMGYICLSLKCDLLDDVKDEITLRQRLNIKYDFFELFKVLNDNNLKVIILIDQLDAVSESLLTDRSIANFYYDWIHKLLKNLNVQVVVTCRDYDLQKDDLLGKFNQGRNVVPVKALQASEITQILALLEIDYNSLKPALQKLLATPLHLDIFCCIAGNMDKIHWQDIQSINNLYDKLWEQRIETLKGGLSEKAKVVLYRLAQDFFKNQKLVGSEKKYRNVNNLTIKALETNNLLIINDKNIQFFHQTFFDYVFARSFVEDDKNRLTQVLRDKSKQNLFVRSAVRYVLAYLRDYDKHLYCEEIETFLSQSEQFRFHLQILAIEQLARLVDPNDDELKLVEKWILPNNVFKGVFSEYVNNVAWFRLLEDYFLNQLKVDSKNIGILYDVLPRVVKLDSDLVFDFIEKLVQEKLVDSDSLLFLLEQVKFYESDRIFDIFDSNCGLNWERTFFLEKVVHIKSDWVMKKLWEHAEDWLKQNTVNRRHIYERYDYFTTNETVKDIWAKLVQIHPKKAYLLTKRLLYHFVFQTRIKDNRFYNDMSFYHYMVIPSRQDDDGSNFFLFKILKNYLIQQFQTGDKNWVRQEITIFLRKNSVACIGLGLEIMDEIGNELADLLYKRLLQNSYVPQFQSETNSNIKYLTRLLLGRFFACYTYEQKQQLVLRIVNFIITANDKYYFKSKVNINGITHLFYDSYKTISVIDEMERNKHPLLKQIYQEWHRKFGDIQNQKPSADMKRSVVSSISEDRFVKMSFNALKKSMHGIKKYDNYILWLDEIQVNQRDHSKMFAKSVAANYNRYLPLLIEILPDREIPDIYKYDSLDAIIEKANKDTSNIIFNKIVLDLYLLYIDNECINQNIILLCRHAETLNIKDIRIVVFLEKIATTSDTDFTYEIDNADFLKAQFNSLEGAAISALFSYLKLPNVVERVFTICEIFAKKQILSLNIVILEKIAYLLNYDVLRTLQLFSSLVNNTTPIALLNNAIPSLQYLVRHDFQRFIPIIKRILIENTPQFRERQFIEPLVVNAALYYEYSGADELLDLAVKRQYSVISYAIKIIEETNKWQKSAAFIQKSFDLVMDDNKNAYVSLLRTAKGKYLERWYPILITMLQKRPDIVKQIYWIDYLEYCDPKHYKKCVELLGYFHKIDSYQYIRKGSHAQLIGKLYKIAESKGDSNCAQELLDIYDEILKNPIIRGREKFDILNDY